jgi:peroxiredoxin
LLGTNALQAYYQDHREQGFIIVGIEAGEPSDQVAEFAREFGLTFPIWLDPENKALDAFRNLSLPSSYVIDRQGNVRLAWLGMVSRAALEEYLTPMLAD